MTLPWHLLVRRGDHIAFAVENSDIVAANLLTSEVHILSGTGATIWGLVDGVSSIESIIDVLFDTYPDGNREGISRQVAAYVEDLSAAGLVELSGPVKLPE